MFNSISNQYPTPLTRSVYVLYWIPNERCGFTTKTGFLVPAVKVFRVGGLRVRAPKEH